MKIGEFCKLFNKKKSTIRHYVDMHLILPEKNGSSFKYNDKCIEDMKSVLEFIELGFSLDEIKMLKTYERLIVSNQHNNIEPINALVDDIIHQTEKEIIHLNERLHKIYNYKDDLLNNKPIFEPVSGTSITCIKHLACPTCNVDFKCNQLTIENDVVVSGYLKCTCGNEYKFEDGILIDCKKGYLSRNSKPVKIQHLNEINDIIPPESLSKMILSGEYLRKKISTLGDNNLYLFLGSDIDICMVNIHMAFSSENTYVFHSLDKQAILRLKRKLSDIKATGHYIFLNTCSNIPIKNHVSHIIDMTATTIEYHLKLPPFTSLHMANKFFSESPSFIMHLSAQSFTSDSKYKYFSLDELKQEFLKLKLEIIDETSLGKFKITDKTIPAIKAKHLNLNMITIKKPT